MIEQLREVRHEEVMARRRTGPDFPFLLISSRMQNHTNSGIKPDGLVKTGYNPVFMNPADMEASGLQAGDMVRIRSRHGTITSFAEPDRDLRTGVIAIMHGFGARPDRPYDARRDGANVNDLLSWEDDHDPHHGMPRMSAVPVTVEPA
jgi:anaerobic selenocysteine-containing dehydrogenase